MPTTAHGLPYPSPTVPPNVPVDIQALAEKLEAILYGTTWTTFASGVTGIARYKVIGSVVYVQIDGTYNSTSGTTHTLSTTPLPAAVRPSVTARGAGYFSGYSGVISVIAPSGDVTAIQQSGAGRTSVSGTFSYPLG